MNRNLCRYLFISVLPALFCSMLTFSSIAQGTTNRLIIENGNNPLSSEQARQEKEQWNDTRNLRKKINTRTEKEFDKVDTAIDSRDACEKSVNVNVYWEPDTLRCLDRRTGRQATP
ncbi:DUF1283 family protein [Enterobacteriaceae bacterium LUAb1]